MRFVVWILLRIYFFELSERLCVFSVSQDQTALLWEWDIERNDLKSVCICRGHERSVNCVDARPSKSVFVTGGWDSSVKIWSTG